MLERLLSNPLSIYFSLVSAGLLLGCIVLFYSRVRLLGGASATGQVVGYNERILMRRGAKRQYMPVVRFQPHDGPPVELQSRFGGSTSALSIGEPVQVRYLPDSPQKAEIATIGRLWLAPFVLLGMALVMIYATWKTSLR
jgi:hypothetical protein